jgi:hypothetical protein
MSKSNGDEAARNAAVRHGCHLEPTWPVAVPQARRPDLIALMAGKVTMTDHGERWRITLRFAGLAEIVRGGVSPFLYPDLKCPLTNLGMVLETGCFRVDKNHSTFFTMILRYNRSLFVTSF